MHEPAWRCRQSRVAQPAQQSSTRQASQSNNLLHAASLPRGMRSSPAGQAMRQGVTPHRYLVVAKRALSGPAGHKQSQDLQGCSIWLWHLYGHGTTNFVHGARKVGKTSAHVTAANLSSSTTPCATGWALNYNWPSRYTIPPPKPPIAVPQCTPPRKLAMVAPYATCSSPALATRSAGMKGRLLAIGGDRQRKGIAPAGRAGWPQRHGQSDSQAMRLPPVAPVCVCPLNDEGGSSVPDAQQMS